MPSKRKGKALAAAPTIKSPSNVKAGKGASKKCK